MGNHAASANSRSVNTTCQTGSWSPRSCTAAREIGTLLAAFDRVAANGRPEVVLVSGYSGIGKSAVVNELHKGLVLPRGLFASGKFDQYKRDIPYATLAQAFQALIRQILSKSDEEADRWRKALRDALDLNGSSL